MSLIEDIENDVDNLLGLTWNIRVGETVPTSESIVLRDGAVELDATYAYADLASSSKLAQDIKQSVTAKIIRSYLAVSARTLRHYGGHIRSFDGDRVMAIFIGGTKNTNAVRAALAINWAVVHVLKPKFASEWSDLSDHWTLHHGVGIDTGAALLVRGGVHNDNDIISIGSAPNVAAKLSEIRGGKPLNITKTVYKAMNNSVAFKDDLNTIPMWEDVGFADVGGTLISVLGSNYYWEPS